MQNNKWDRRFLELAQHVASWSKDKSTKAGAVIVDDNRRVVSLGYNGLPQGVDDAEERYENREIKYKMILHAERNAIIFAKRPLDGCTIFTCPFQPCAVCATMVIQAGITRCVAAPLPEHLVGRWGEDVKLSTQMLKEAGIELVLLEENNGLFEICDG